MDGFGSIHDLLKKNASSGSAGPTGGSVPHIASEETAQKYEEKMREIAVKEKEKAAMSNAEELGISYIALDRFPIGPETLMLVPEETAKELRVVCFYRTQKEIRLATTDPTNEQVTAFAKDLEEKYYSLVQLYLISDYSFEKVMKLYDALPKIRKVVRGVEIVEEDLEKFKKELKTYHDLEEKIQHASVTDMVAMIIAGSMQARASDIHIEAEEKDIKIRYRIDGLLQEVGSLKKELWPQLIARVKLLAGLKINVANKPQDGRFTIFLTNDKIDVRVSVLPTAFGESIVIRLLISSASGLSFDDLGIRGRAFEQLKREVERPNGMIITTGPTGSGKTTTLYAILTKLNTADAKIITIEDPVEYQLQGINQSQVDASRGYTFAGGLRSVLRQDPDVVMVGEIRDLETAETAIQAALTGHLVLSTIHTNSASGTIPRFLSMGAKPFLLAPSVNAMIGQRLVRKLCDKCKKEITIEGELLERVKKSLEVMTPSAGVTVDFTTMKFFGPGGCEFCQKIGYRGRIGIYEVMTMNKDIEKMILSGQLSEYDIEANAIQNGMVTMAQDGLLKALDGITSVDEVFRVAE